jgi:uncharacterized protein (DUF58 family)
MLTARGRLALVLGVGVYVVAWAFGADALYPLAVGLVLAVVLAWTWVRVLDRPMSLRRIAWGGEHVEGNDVSVVLELEHDGRFTPRALPVIEQIGGLGEFEVVLEPAGGTLTGRYVVPRVPRGRYPIESSTAVLADPFELERVEIPLGGGGALVVYPRLVELDELFSEAGAHAQGGRRLLLRRPTGFDLHSVREYQQGESLRRVHWPSTAKRGQLMVKELEDEPRDEVAVVLDAAADSVAGEPPDSSFDMQVRAAGSILQTYARRGRRAVLAINSATRETQSLRAEDGDWRRALELLAAAQPTGRAPVATLLGDGASAASRALEVTVVTAQLSIGLVERLAQRAQSNRSVSVVYVEAPTFAGRSPAREPALLRLQAAGVPVTVLRHGDDLRSRLAGAHTRAASLG